VEYTVGNVEVELVKKPANYVKRWLVPVPHDEMTVQQNDGKKRSWVLDGEHTLKKKGVGCGIHLSGVICATKGYLFEADQTLEFLSSCSHFARSADGSISDSTLIYYVIASNTIDYCDNLDNCEHQDVNCPVFCVVGLTVGCFFHI